MVSPRLLDVLVSGSQAGQSQALSISTFQSPGPGRPSGEGAAPYRHRLDDFQSLVYMIRQFPGCNRPGGPLTTNSKGSNAQTAAAHLVTVKQFITEHIRRLQLTLASLGSGSTSSNPSTGSVDDFVLVSSAAAQGTGTGESDSPPSAAVAVTRRRLEMEVRVWTLLRALLDSGGSVSDYCCSACIYLYPSFYPICV